MMKLKRINKKQECNSTFHDRSVKHIDFNFDYVLRNDGVVSLHQWLFCDLMRNSIRRNKICLISSQYQAKKS
ncbi:hypothetical protein T11_15344 [Trichinella zimbabwensis]|uniref:Uncharacterized protein n=1 Tax=Trichinella zimbabwensis TaxID=268475 RepID=A0A0V1I2N2_9BILA|nr:hypothetical protein T11_15344 [Trichinella zimbabwensis]